MRKPALSLVPARPSVEGIAVYETKMRLYIVGSNSHGTRFRVLKIDRMSVALNIVDDGIEYTREQVRNLLMMIDEGNRSLGGIFGKVSAYALLGAVRFLEGYYLILVTKRRRVALIGAHYIYKIEDTAMVPVLHPSAHVQRSADETHYLKTFHSVDLTSNFYYSHTYDLTHGLQYQMVRSDEMDATLPSGRVDLSRFNDKFIWNHYLLQPLINHVHRDWILPIIHGFVSQANLAVFRRPIYVTLIARRSRRMAGTRFLKRGANDAGWVANDVESEQIVHDASRLSSDTGGYTSFRQMRGSIPLFWSQDTKGLATKPPIQVDRVDPCHSPAALHFDELFRIYGSPIIVLNVVKKQEKKPRESILHREFGQCVRYLNRHLPPDHQLIYSAWDMANCAKSKNPQNNVLERLALIGVDAIRITGFFHSGKQVAANRVREEQGMQIKVGGVSYDENSVQGRRQLGVLRTNCIDCLDRTNMVEFMVGKCALGHQLYALGVIDWPHVEFDCAAFHVLKTMYEDHGDTIALQYGGSQLVNTLETYRQTSQWTSNSRDILHTIQRYYSNSFTDADKQGAINLFLGVFRPSVHSNTSLWNLSTDYYLHYHPPWCGYRMPRRNHVHWWHARLGVCEEDQDTLGGRRRRRAIAAATDPKSMRGTTTGDRVKERRGQDESVEDEDLSEEEQEEQEEQEEEERVEREEGDELAWSCGSSVSSVSSSSSRSSLVSLPAMVVRETANECNDDEIAYRGAGDDGLLFALQDVLSAGRDADSLVATASSMLKDDGYVDFGTDEEVTRQHEPRLVRWLGGLDVGADATDNDLVFLLDLLSDVNSLVPKKGETAEQKAQTLAEAQQVSPKERAVEMQRRIQQLQLAWTAPTGTDDRHLMGATAVTAASAAVAVRREKYLRQSVDEVPEGTTGEGDATQRDSFSETTATTTTTTSSSSAAAAAAVAASGAAAPSLRGRSFSGYTFEPADDPTTTSKGSQKMNKLLAKHRRPWRDSGEGPPDDAKTIKDKKRRKRQEQRQQQQALKKQRPPTAAERIAAAVAEAAAAASPGAKAHLKRTLVPRDPEMDSMGFRAMKWVLSEFYNENELESFKEGEDGMFAFNIMRTSDAVKGFDEDQTSPFQVITTSSTRKGASKDKAQEREVFGVERWLASGGGRFRESFMQRRQGKGSAGGGRHSDTSDASVAPQTMRDAYGCEVDEPDTHDCHAYVLFLQLAHQARLLQNRKVTIEEGVVCLANTTVDQHIYANCVDVGLHGPREPHTDSVSSLEEYTSSQALYARLTAPQTHDPDGKPLVRRSRAY